MEEDNSAYSEIKKLRRKNMRLVFIINEMLTYINDQTDLFYLTEKIEKIKSIE
jgi:hypothetical protein